MIFIRRLESLDAMPVSGTEGVTGAPFWSADGTQIGFAANGKLRRVAVSGGPPQDLAAVVEFRGGAWSQTGVVLFADGSAGLRRVTASGQEEASVTSPDAKRGEIAHAWPVFLEDGRRFLYFSFNGQPGASAIHAGMLDSTERTEILRVASMPAYASSGHLLFHCEGTLMAQSFDAGRTTLVGDAVPVMPNIAFRPELGGSRAAFAVSASGNLVYCEGDSSFLSRLTWYDRTGRRVEEVGLSPGAYRGVALSPDGKLIAVHRHEERGGDIWIRDQARGTFMRLTDDGAHNVTPVWSPDGQWVAFGADDGNGNVLYRKNATGVGEQEQLGARGFPEDWSPDGSSLLYAASPDRNLDIFWLRLAGQPTPRRL